MENLSRKNVTIHPMAIVHPKAMIGEGSCIGPFSVIGEDVIMGNQCEIQEHVILRGKVQIGHECKFFPGVVVGAEPQQRKYHGEPTFVEIGNRVTLREYVTIHRGTSLGIGKTVIGDETLLMAYTHIGHDCVIGKKVTMANGCQIAGHVEVHDFANLGGGSLIVQFSKIGRFTFLGAGSVVNKDIPPFVSGKGQPFKPCGINSIGLERQSISQSEIECLKKLYRIFFLRSYTTKQAIEQIQAELGFDDNIHLFVNFVRSSKLGIVR
jgi:UDP-N-acetylglucosamine acyltransferase